MHYGCLCPRDLCQVDAVAVTNLYSNSSFGKVDLYRYFFMIPLIAEDMPVIAPPRIQVDLTTFSAVFAVTRFLTGCHFSNMEGMQKIAYNVFNSQDRMFGFSDAHFFYL